MNKVDFNFYLITNRMKCENLLYTVEEALKGGVRAVQLREKDLTGDDLLSLAVELRELTNKYDAKLLINSRIDIALASNADGVHLSEKGFPIEKTRLSLGDDKLIGKSTHSRVDALKALKEGADFVTLSPVFYTESKKEMGEPLGLEEFKGLEDKNVFALGGINVGNIDEVVKNNINRVALIGAVIGAADIKGEAEYFINKLTSIF